MSRLERSTVSLSFLVGCALLATTALVASSYLAYVGLTASAVVGCDGGVFNCEHVLTSRWSKILGIPVSLPAVGLYVIVIGAIACLRNDQGSRRQIASTIVIAGAFAATTAAAWFVSLQIFSIGHFCPYCLVVHICGVLLTGLMLWKRPQAWGKARYAGLSGVMAGLAMVAIQAVSPVPDTFTIEANDVVTTPETFDPFLDPLSDEEMESNSELFDAPTAMSMNPLWLIMGVLAAEAQAGETSKENEVAPAKTPRLVPVSGGRKQLDAHKWPVWGNVEGAHVIAEMFDYTCEHCRNTHRAIREANTQLGNDFGVVMLPVPLHRNCNDAATNSSPERADACEIAKIAISVWLVDRTKFTGYHDWLFEQSRSAVEARLQASQLVGAEALTTELQSGRASKYIAKNVMLYKDAGAGSVPKIVFATTTLVGEVGSGRTIADFARQSVQR